ncbi:hypothetical protein NE236_42930 [Actinoallomurus purpureus]|uniref:hypothetical protein n=1 Tax=Actinoallomurus purpureus TaxID=478114 RepID=UPI002093FF56|nr:hypothetical protein [Actinoallomurus purpureus]MCO6011722.1 hypothetical protein [Actinoallomurus purpureus]
MKSAEARQQWRDVLELVRLGGRVVIEHYNRPVAIVLPYVPELEDVHISEAADVAQGRPAGLGEVDRDAVFEAVEDLVTALLETAADLGDDVGRAAAGLGEQWGAVSGDGPIDDLAAAVRGVVEAVRRHSGPVPAPLTEACAAAENALTISEKGQIK